MATNKRFVAKNGLDNDANSISNLGVKGASLALSGAFATTLTATAATNVTLPITGTLATLAESEALTNKTINKVTITAPATGSTLTIADGKTLTASNTLTFTGTDASNVAFSSGGTVAYTGNKLSAFASTSSSELASVLSDETGTGVVVFGTSPTFTTTIDGGATFGAFASSTNLTVGYTGVAASSTNISTGINPTGVTKTVNIGTGGAVGSTTNVNIGGGNGGLTTVNRDLKVLGNTVLDGNLTVSGNTTTLNSVTLVVYDKNIELAKVTSPTDTTADGAGITVKGATDKTITWDSANNNWTSSENWNLATGKSFKINNVEVFGATSLGANITSSSLTSVGTIGTGTWQGTIIAGQYGGTGINNSGKTITLGGNLTTSGAFATTLIATAATSVTLPITGTLATLAETETFTNKSLTSPTITGTGSIAAGVITLDSETVLIDSSTLTTATKTVDQVLASVSATKYRTVEFTISVTSGAYYQAIKILVVHDGSVVFLTQYGEILTNPSQSLATFTADILANNIRLLTTPVLTNTTYKVSINAISV